MASVEAIGAWVREARQTTLDLIADLDDGQLVPPLLATVNPLLWEVGHLGWFQERFVLRQARGRPGLLPEADALWDSAAIPHDTRWRLVLPDREQTRAYVRRVAEEVVEALAREPQDDVAAHFARYSVAHEDMHAEALTYTRQTLGYPAPVLSRLPRSSPPGPADPEDASGDADVPGGVLWLGARRREPFVFDNEKWAHPVQVAPFRIARRAVTQAEFAAFVDDGGYRRPALWGDEGWTWRQAVGAEHPLYWRQETSGWARRHFDTWVPLEADHPMVHLSWYEADAFCRWAGRRLPTEAEWELAAAGRPVGEGFAASRYPWGEDPVRASHANLDWQAMGPSPVAAYPEGDSPVGCRQMLGNVWEWTATTFGPYPNFERDAYQEMSEPFFGTRKVLRGGSWATPSRLARAGLRNYFTPDRRDVVAGLRTCPPRE